ncbi:MAG: family 10 glycosylhydrolase [Bacteroidales bacterium]|nr:family 10 glycosylhydrolase [Bacteroidales bacterium]
MQRKLLLIILLVISQTICSIAQVTPKREFRGVWMHTIAQSQYKDLPTAKLKQYLIEALDYFKACNMNAVIFQVRPQADAFYESSLEPWSRYLTGVQGQAPEPYFDPMAFMIEECHKRGLEFHAWLNPYRVSSSESQELANSHIYHQHPEWFVKYGKQLYFDPGIPESRRFIRRVVRDIVSRYDVDAIHMDDYFYPYPVAGLNFPDGESFAQYGGKYYPDRIGDWRRNNVNLLIEELKTTILLTKPWVRFGISPFGIYRNKKNSTNGSETNGLQNYDDLYADIKLWVKNQWIDYNIPQIYWEIGHKAADYETLIKWWDKNNYGGHLYIGQDVVRTMKAPDLKYSSRNQLTRKMELERSLPNVHGNCWWPGYEVWKNTGGVADSLFDHYQKYPALIPAYTHMHDKAPKEVRKMKTKWTEKGYMLSWQTKGKRSNPENAQYFVVYRFPAKGKADLSDPSKIVAITRDPYYLMPYKKGERKYKYVVTAVDRFHNESTKGKSKKVKL